MYIRRVKINNFKKWNELNIELNQHLNLFLGTNNSGKTTILEALLLWKKCYDSNIQTRGRGFYSSSKNLSFYSLPFLRVENDSDLFHKKTSSIRIELLIEIEGKNFDLGFKIKRPTHVKNTYLQVQYTSKSEFNRFYNHISSKKTQLKKSISISYSSPLAQIPSYEEYYYKPQIRKYLESGNSDHVLRNKIINESKNIISVQNVLSEIFDNEYTLTHTKNPEAVNINLNLSNGYDKNELSTYGSGVLQICELFSSFEFLDSLLHIALIDEPDAHIHASLQKKVVEELRKQKNTQFFIVSHNLNFIELFDESERIKLEERSTMNIDNDSAYNHLEVVNEIKGETQKTDELQNSKVLVFVEGESDKEFFTELIRKYNVINSTNINSIYFIPVLGIDFYKQKIPFMIKEVKNHLKNDEINSVLILDTDYLSIQETRKVLDNPPKGLDKIFFQDGLCLESVIFQNPKILKKLISNVSLLNNEIIDSVVENTIKSYKESLTDATSEVFNILDKAFTENRQRKNIGLNKEFTISKFIKQNSHHRFRYLANKKITNMILKEMADKINKNYSKEIEIDNQIILNEYISSINENDDFLTFHKDVIKYLQSLAIS